MLEMLSAEQLDRVLVTDDARCNPKIINLDEDVVFITHSSGSTSLPKLFPVTHAGTATKLRPEWLATIAPRDKRLYMASAFYNIVGFWSMITCVNKAEPTIYDNDVFPFTSGSLISSLKETQPHWARVSPTRCS